MTNYIRKPLETKELFPKQTVTEDEVKQEVKRREMADSISVEYKSEGENWIIITKWPELAE